MYTTNVVSTQYLRSLTATPTIGPFKIDDKEDCYWDPNNGDLSCLKKTDFCGKCANGVCGGQHQPIANHLDMAVYCEYSTDGIGSAKTAGVCAW